MVGKALYDVDANTGKPRKALTIQEVATHWVFPTSIFVKWPMTTVCQHFTLEGPFGMVLKTMPAGYKRKKLPMPQQIRQNQTSTKA